MNNLKVDFDTQTISARELHEKLNIGTEFAKWFSRMCEYGFSTENDYSEVIVKMTKTRKVVDRQRITAFLLTWQNRFA